jgi:hypothetical protein
MNEDLTPEQKNEVWLIACELGIDTVRARTEWERRKAQNRPQPKPEPVQEVTEEETETEEPEPSKLEDLKLENERQKSVILDQIQKKLWDEENAETETDNFIRLIKNNEEIQELTRGYISIILSFIRFKTPDKAIITIQRDDKQKQLHFGYKLLDKNGKDVRFDENGNVIKND